MNTNKLLSRGTKSFLYILLQTAVLATASIVTGSILGLFWAIAFNMRYHKLASSGMLQLLTLAIFFVSLSLYIWSPRRRDTGEIIDADDCICEHPRTKP